MNYGQVKDHDMFTVVPLDNIMLALLEVTNLPVAICGEGSTWQDNAEAIAEMFRQHYRRYRLLYDYEETEKTIYNAIYRNRQKLNLLVDSTLFDYNPIENYNMEEVGTDAGEAYSDGTSSGDNNIKNYEFPMDSGSRKLVNETESTSNVTASHREDSDSRTHNLTRKGNIGVTTTQQMIEAQRKIAVSCFDYVREIIDDYLFLDDDYLD